MTHQRIFDTALQLFQEHGFPAVNVGQIARTAGVSVPTFYAHYPSKEHIVMALPTREDVVALFAGQPPHLPVADQIRRATPQWVASWPPDLRESQLQRWRIIATTPALRTRAADFERISAGMVGQVIPDNRGTPLEPSETVLVNAYLAAYTTGLLAWADCNGERKLEELIDESFDALRAH